MKYPILFALCLTLFCSCLRSDNYVHTHTVVLKPVNFNLSEGKWIIDEPIVKKADITYQEMTMTLYKKILGEKIKDLKPIHDFSNVPTLKNHIAKDLKVLDLYKQRTDYDYLISTTLDLVDNKANSLTKEVDIKIVVYDLNEQKPIFEKDYVSQDPFTGFKDKPLPSKLENFMKVSIRKAIKDFAKDYNWNAIY